MSQYSSTCCVIQCDLEHKRWPLFVRNTDASFIRGRSFVVGGSAACSVRIRHFSFSSSAGTCLSTNQPCCIKLLCTSEQLTTLIIELLKLSLRGEKKSSKYYQCSDSAAQKSFAEIVSGFHHCCKSKVDLFFWCMFPHRMLPGWKRLCVPQWWLWETQNEFVFSDRIFQAITCRVKVVTPLLNALEYFSQCSLCCAQIFACWAATQRSGKLLGG